VLQAAELHAAGAQLIEMNNFPECEKNYGR